MAAVPAELSCAAPTTPELVHESTFASQKITTPGITGAPPAVTVAVKETIVPEGTLVTALPPAAMASIVAVAVAAAA
jgi:hypothetical protein